MPFKSYREESKSNWGASDREINHEDLRIGALLRIADATEVMSKDYQQLIKDKEFYKGASERLRGANATLHRRITALKGVITRMKKAQEK